MFAELVFMLEELCHKKAVLQKQHAINNGIFIASNLLVGGKLSTLVEIHFTIFLLLLRDFDDSCLPSVVIPNLEQVLHTHTHQI